VHSTSSDKKAPRQERPEERPHIEEVVRLSELEGMGHVPNVPLNEVVLDKGVPETPPHPHEPGCRRCRSDCGTGKPSQTAERAASPRHGDDEAGGAAKECRRKRHVQEANASQRECRGQREEHHGCSLACSRILEDLATTPVGEPAQCERRKCARNPRGKLG